MRICPVNREWIHTYLLEPYLQGAEMVNRAWKGVDFHSLNSPPLTLKERVISWLVGIALMIPLVNIIIWISWQTLGKPEKLFDPYSPEVELPPPPPPPVFVHPQPAPAVPVPPVAPGQARPVDLFAYNETGKNFMIRTNWKVERHPNLIVAQQHCTEYSSTSIYKLDWTILEFHYQFMANPCTLPKKGDIEKFDIWLTDPQHVRIRIVKTGEALIDITKGKEEPLPWIQQPTIGFKNFILSPESEMSFYGVLPENPNKLPFAAAAPLLIKAVAKKMGEVEVPGHGRLMKVEIVSAWGWPYDLVKGELWFDPATGILRKFIDPGLLIKKSGEFVQAHPLPAPARP